MENMEKLFFSSQVGAGPFRHIDLQKSDALGLASTFAAFALRTSTLFTSQRVWTARSTVQLLELDCTITPY